MLVSTNLVLMLSNFSIFQLVKNYGHIGGPASLTNINSLFYIIGKYYGVSIIDVNKNLFLFRNYFFLISNVILKGGYLFLIWNNLKFSKFSPNCAFCRFMYRWVPGTITNFRRVKKINLEKNFSNKQHFLNDGEKLRFPNFVINFGFNRNIETQEGNRLPLPFLSIVDTAHNISNFSFFVLYNTKSIYSSFFLYNVFLDFLGKMSIIKKSFFFNIFKKKLFIINGTQSKK